MVFRNYQHFVYDFYRNIILTIWCTKYIMLYSLWLFWKNVCSKCKSTVSWKFGHCLARTSLKYEWLCMNTDYVMKKKISFFYEVLLKKKNFIYCDPKQKKYLVVFHEHETNSLHVYYLINWVIFGLFFSFFMENWMLRYFSKYFFQNVLKFCFYNLHFLKVLWT